MEAVKLEIVQLKKALATAQATETTRLQRSYTNVASRETGAGANKAHNYRSKPLDGPGSNTENTTLGESTVSMNKIKVVGAHRIWGTLKSVVVLRPSKV